MNMNQKIDKSETSKEENIDSLMISETELQGYSGPIPPAEQIYKYEKASKGSAKIIFKMAELHAKTTSEVSLINAKVLERDSKTQRCIFLIVPFLIFFICISVILSATFLIYIGKEVYGILLIGTISILVLLAAIIRNLKAKWLGFSIESEKDKIKET